MSGISGTGGLRGEVGSVEKRYLTSITAMLWITSLFGSREDTTTCASGSEMAKAGIKVETVEKPSILGLIMICKSLILLGVEIVKMCAQDFFDRFV